MSAVGVGGVIRYGVELLAYHFVIYLIGGVIMGIGAVFLGAGIDSLGDPGVLVGAGIFLVAGWVVIVAGELGIIYKVIADSVMAGMEKSRDNERSRGQRSTSSQPSPASSQNDRPRSDQ